uniref:SXP/RAL-2 family protein Ani s 5-like cation-binding domain-containing protein n=1 Tax=Strongyloides stercoralis TaxID=6248 RepID=A0AAF5DPV2_STRER
MHFIKYLAIFAIIALQLTLQGVYSDDSSNQSVQSSEESNGNQEQPVALPQEKSFLKGLKTKFSDKTKKLKNSFDKAKEKMEDLKNKVEDKMKNNKGYRKTVEVKEKVAGKLKDAGKNVKDKFGKIRASGF